MATAKTLTTNELALALGVSTMTIWLWRQGTPTKTKLPFEQVDPEAVKPRVVFKLGEVKKWARENGVEWAQQPADVIGLVTTARPGPRPKAKKRTKH